MVSLPHGTPKKVKSVNHREVLENIESGWDPDMDNAYIIKLRGSQAVIASLQVFPF